MKSILIFIAFVVLAFVLNQQISEGNLFAQGVAVSAGVLFIGWVLKYVR